MKHSRANKSSGSVLLGTMIFVLAIAAFLEAYLYVVENSNQSTARAQQWNSALAIAEAGVEEGLANLNQVGITTSSNATTFTPFSRSLNGGTYSAISSAAGVVSTVTSTGIVSAPINGDSIMRTVRITAQRQGLFSKGMISMTYINMNGNDTISDSYNSHNPAQSQNGAYNGSYYSGTNGDIAAVNGLVNIGNETIQGDLYLGPNSTFKKGPNGEVTGIIYTDWNMIFPPVFAPTVDTNNLPLPSPWPAAPGTTASHTFTNSGYYTITDNGTITVKPGVTVTLDVRQPTSTYSPSGFDIQGGMTNAGTVVIYQRSGSLTLSGNAAGGAANSRPENFSYFGLSGVTDITLSGSSSFVGVIYAPTADMTISGGGSGLNFMGSLIVKSLTVNGHFELHYDTSLMGYYYGYYVAGYWEEL